MKELTLYELKKTDGGVLIGAPPSFILDTAIIVGKMASAWWKGFKDGSEFV